MSEPRGDDNNGWFLNLVLYISELLLEAEVYPKEIGSTECCFCLR